MVHTPYVAEQVYLLAVLSLFSLILKSSCKRHIPQLLVVVMLAGNKAGYKY